MSGFITGTVDSADGPFSILLDDDGRVISSGWTTDVDELIGRLGRPLRPTTVRSGDVTAAAEAVAAYYDGDVEPIMDVPVFQSGTPMLEEGWRLLRRIPAGTVLSYSELAAELDKPTAVRAAASVCARCAPALFVPCHRVRRADGTLGGYAWGLDIKASLLAREGGSGR